MNSYLLIATVGLCYVAIFGGLSALRREGLSNQFAVEVLGFTALVVVGSVLTSTPVNPVLFLAFVYLISMRVRLLVDLANLLSTRGRQRDAMTVLQWALHLYPDRSTQMIILVNMGMVQLRRQNPESAQALLESVLEEAKGGGLGIKYEAACRYHLGLALKRQGKEAEAVHQFNETIGTYPNSTYSRAAEKALEQRRLAREDRPTEAPDGTEIS